MFNNDFQYRLRNIKLICELLPENMNIIIVEQIFDNTIPSYVEELQNTKLFRSDIKYITKYYEKDFVKGWLYNVGYKNALTNNLFLGESDVIFSPIYWSSVIRQLNNHNFPWAHCWDKLYQIASDNTSIIRQAKPHPGGPEGGIVYFKKTFYESIGGNNEWMTGLGGMDNEIITRCAYMSRSRIKIKGDIYHIWHPFSEMKGTNTNKNLKTENKYKESRIKNRKISLFVTNKTKLVINTMLNYKNRIGGDVPLCDTEELFDDNGKINIPNMNSILYADDINLPKITEISCSPDENAEIEQKTPNTSHDKNRTQRNILYRNGLPYNNRRKSQKKIIKNPAVKFTR